MRGIVWISTLTWTLLVLGCSSTSSHQTGAATKAAPNPAVRTSTAVSAPAALRAKKPAATKAPASENRRAAELEAASRGYRGVHGNWPSSPAVLRKWLRDSKQSDRFLDEFPNLVLVSTRNGGLVLTWGSNPKARQSLYVSPPASRVKRPIESRTR